MRKLHRGIIKYVTHSCARGREPSTPCREETLQEESEGTDLTLLRVWVTLGFAASRTRAGARSRHGGSHLATPENRLRPDGSDFLHRANPRSSRSKTPGPNPLCLQQ